MTDVRSLEVRMLRVNLTNWTWYAAPDCCQVVLPTYYQNFTQSNSMQVTITSQ